MKRRRSTMHAIRSLLLFALVLSSSSAIAVAQDYSPRHGFWGEAGLGFGPATFTCNSCDYHRATANNRSQLGGWAISFGMGGTPSPRLRVGAEYWVWLHGLRMTACPRSSFSVSLSRCTPATRGVPSSTWEPGSQITP